ncbi:MAG: quinoprotein dehydrogenase-associated SoxYZ-like carrier [Hyphomicrobiales bacterium]|nr:quinoprotein dehydrogenase-associated SoxYZ-like carrier [Hyphomicrobiales bacterium]
MVRGNLLAGSLVALMACSGALALDRPDLWPGLAKDIFASKAISKDADIATLEAPARAEDAAIVPMTINLAKPATQVRKATLVIDQNPAPMAASFTIGANSGLTQISTRVRVNDYTEVHLVSETTDGSLHMVERFVKAAGGCSAPSVKSLDEANANIGQMKFRTIAASDLGDARRREAQIMIRHPNNSGLQMDQVTRLYIPARYIDQVKVTQGDDLIFQMEGGISISEDPNFRFTFVPNGSKTITVEAHDTDGKVWRSQFPIEGAS